MSKRKYSLNFFITGFLIDVLLRHVWLLLPAVILCIVGIFVPLCLYIGLGLLVINILWSLIKQIQMAHVLQKDSDNPEFIAIQDALTDKNWRHNVTSMVEQKIEESKPYTPDEKENPTSENE